MNKNGWYVLATGAIVLSLITLLLPIVSYTNAVGVTRSFNAFAIATDSTFAPFIFNEYQGEFLYGVSYGTITLCAVILCIIGLGAIILAFVGINSMTKQYESSKPFEYAVLGLVGTAIPSIVLLALYFVSASQYPGTMTVGPYLIVTPLAMLAAIGAVTARHRVSREEAQARAAAAAYIRPAGDLPVVDFRTMRENDYYVR